jgi:hypothetical protein
MADHTAHTAAFRAMLAGHPVRAGKFGNVDLVDTIFRVLAEGHFRANAAAIAGVSEDTIDDWVKRGEQDVPEEPYTTFAASVRCIRAEVEADRERHVQDSKDWRAQAWLLEIHNRSRYGPKNRLELTGRGGGPVAIASIDVTSLSDEQLEALIATNDPRSLGSQSDPGGTGEPGSGEAAPDEGEGPPAP